MSTLTANSTVAEWVCQHPQTARVFEELQIDYCCGGGIALVKACESRNIDTNSVVGKLEESLADDETCTDKCWADENLTDLIEHIVSTHHAYLRRELPRLTQLVDKVVAAHGKNHPAVVDLYRVFSELRAELEPHMLKEEQILFPAIRELEKATQLLRFPFGTVANPIHMMEHEHDQAGNLLQKIRELTTEYCPPEDACNTFRVLYASLEELEFNTHQHIHKENNILFPRAQELEDSFNLRIIG